MDEKAFQEWANAECLRVNLEFNRKMLARLNNATAEALDKMKRGEVPLLDPAFEPDVCAAAKRAMDAQLAHNRAEWEHLKCQVDAYRNQADGAYRNGCPIITEGPQRDDL